MKYLFPKGHKINLGRKHSEETKRKMSEVKKGKIPKNLELLRTPEIAKKRSQALKGNKNSLGYRQSEETKKKRGLAISIALKGKKKSEEHRKKIIKNLKGGWNKGQTFPQWSKENHPNWKGGKSFEPYSIDWTETLRRAIRERDRYICQLCNSYGDNIHHIDYNKKNCNPDNLITLCRSCNSKVNFNRKYWENYFKINQGREIPCFSGK